MKKTKYNKTILIRELAFSTGLTQKKVRYLLEALQMIAYREAAEDGFTVPGICRLDVVVRKPRRMRNPQTGENILIGEHKALRARLVKQARDAVTPRPDDLITTLPPELEIIDDFSKAISFRCKKCQQEIEAPHGAIGMQAECPSCGAAVVIPAEAEPGTLHGAPLPEPEPVVAPAVPAAASAAPDVAGTAPDVPGFQKVSMSESVQSTPRPLPTIDKTKNQTIRIDLSAFMPGGDSGAAGGGKTVRPKRMLSFFCKGCRQEIEASADMAGLPTECPTCTLNFEVPFFSDPGTLHGSDLEKRSSRELKEIKGRTIRIDIPDDF